MSLRISRCMRARRRGQGSLKNHSRAIVRLTVGGSAGVVGRGRGLVVTWVCLIAVSFHLAGAASRIPRAGRASHRQDRQSGAPFGRMAGGTRRASRDVATGEVTGDLTDAACLARGSWCIKARHCSTGHRSAPGSRWQGGLPCWQPLPGSRRRRWWALAAWMLLFVAGITIGSMVFGRAGLFQRRRGHRVGPGLEHHAAGQQRGPDRGGAGQGAAGGGAGHPGGGRSADCPAGRRCRT